MTKYKEITIILFFNDSTIHKIYIDSGSFNFLYLLPRIIYSSIISSILNTILKALALTEKNILELKKTKSCEINIESKKIIKFLYYKFILFFIISFIFLLFFWYYISSFCAVFPKTQAEIIAITIIAIIFGVIFQFIFALIIAGLRYVGLKYKQSIIYRISQILI